MCSRDPALAATIAAYDAGCTDAGDLLDVAFRQLAEGLGRG